METKKTGKRQQPEASLFEAFRALEHLVPASGLVPAGMARDIVGSIGLALQAAGEGRGDDFARIEDLVDACGERMPAEVARGLVSLARWLAGDRVGATEEVAS